MNSVSLDMFYHNTLYLENQIIPIFAARKSETRIEYSALQRQKAVSVGFIRKQILPFGIAEQYCTQQTRGISLNAVSMLVHRLRRCPIIETALGEYLVFG